MGLFSHTKSPKHEDYERRYHELRRTMQDIVIAHAAACYKHMTPEQLRAVQNEWAQLLAGRGWASFFTDDSMPVPPPRWLPSPDDHHPGTS